MTTNYNNQPEEENFLFGKNKENPFDMPKGYFNSLPSRVMNKIEIVQELEQYRVLAAIDKQYYFSVPQNYFIKNENLLEYKYELAAFTALSKVPKPALKPDTSEYFDALSNKILKQIELSDELKSYSMLSEIKKEKIFSANPEYFETIADRVKERYHSNQKASVFEQLLNLILKPKIAFAYSFVLIVGLGMYLFFSKSNTITETGDCKTLACLEKRELLNDHTMQSLDDDNLYDLVDVEELDKQLTETTGDSLKTTDTLPYNLK
ncbi:MAG: hypothetical protein H0W84_10300 [Bacteroidetes bacterium]|nr:hypothetical protein [Bacteroidota bacterium]